MSTDITPFTGRTRNTTEPTRVLHRFAKPIGHWAEIRERHFSRFPGVEYLVLVDGSLLESQMFYQGREVEYPTELAKRIAQFLDGGWVEVPVPHEPPQ